MISLTVDTSDVDRAITNLSDRHFLHDPMEAGLALLHDYMAQYPVQPSGTSYKRTGDYGRAWTTGQIRTEGGGLHGEIGNAVRSRKTNRAYGPYVGDAERQPVWNRHWRTDAMAVRENEARIRGFFEDALQEVAER